MAIQFNLPNIARRTMPEETGIPDYVSALSKGLDLGYKPSTLANKQFEAEFANKINEAKARHAEEVQLENLKHLRAQTGNLGLTAQNLQQQLSQRKLQMQQDQLLQDLLSGTNKPQEFSGEEQSFVQPLPSEFNQQKTKNTEHESMGGQQNEQVLVPGNPALSKINDIYQNYPQYRKKLESMGYKQQQTVKYDPKTGMSSVITKYPNGEVRIQASGQQPSQIPLTNTVKTQQQSIIANVDRVNRLIDSITSKPSPTEFPFYRKGARATHNALVKEAAETYAKAKGWPNTNASIKAAEQILGRGALESDSDYRGRLDELKKELLRTKSDAHSVLAGKELGQNDTNESSNVVKYIRDKSGKIVPERGL